MKKINIFRFFDPKTFILALGIGLFFVYITAPEPEIIYIYPNPDNVDKILYKDKGDTCYKFKANEIGCPLKRSKIKKYPIQGGNKKLNIQF